MQTYKVYQIRMTDAEIDAIKAGGHDAVPKNKLRLDIQFFNDPDLIVEAFAKGFYTHVCNIRATDLEGVFHVGNMGPEENIERLGDMHSVSVGDVIEDADGFRHMVAKFGFEVVV